MPDYICNVVYIALENAGFQIQTYATDDVYEPYEDQIEARLRDSKVGILLTASVFGSSALLDFLKREEIQSLVQSNNIHVVVDLCQDINLLSVLPTDYSDHLSAIVSFNDKSLPGLMGGGILTCLDIPMSRERASFKQAFSLYRIALSKYCSDLRSRINMTKLCCISADSLKRLGESDFYDYSHCRVFPYTFEIVAITKLQIIMALLGLLNIDRINKKKMKYALECPNVKKTVHFYTSPYLVINKIMPLHSNRKRKRPYAQHRHPEQSLRKNDIIIHNKGFSDFI